MRKLVALFLSLIASHSWAAPASVRQVFLIQNSGWMEPFYLDPASPLKPFVIALIGKSNLSGVPVTVATFNQDGQVAGHHSPEVVFEGAYDAAAVTTAVSGLTLPRKSSGAYADADFKGALTRTFSTILKGNQGVIWLITNNKDAPDNNPAVIANTRAFYGALRSSPHITSIAGFPMRRQVTGPHFREKGLMIYAIAYGARGKAALAVILRDGAPVRKLFPAPPVRLKPLDQDPVELLLDDVTGDAVATVRQSRLFIDGLPGGRATSLRLGGVLRNSYYPQNIDYARIVARWSKLDPSLTGATATMTPAVISGIPADGRSSPVTIELKLPPIRRLPGWSGLFEDQRVVDGELEIHFDDIAFSLDSAFVARIAAISSGEAIGAEQAEAALTRQLPEIYFDYRRISDASLRVPVRMSVHFSAWPLILAIGALALLLALALWLILVALRSRAYVVRIGQGEQRIVLRPRETRIVSDGYGTRATVTGRLFGPPRLTPLADS